MPSPSRVRWFALAGALLAWPACDSTVADPLACRSNSDCGRGYICNLVEQRCYAECYVDEDCSSEGAVCVV